VALSKAQQELVDQIQQLKKEFADTSAADDFIGLFDRLESNIKALTGSAADSGPSLEAFKKRLKDLSDAANDAIAPFEKFDRALKHKIKTLTGVTDSSDGLIGSFVKLTSEAGNVGEAFGQAKKTVDETLTSFNIGVSVAQKLAEGSIGLALANDQATASFNKATGAGGRYNSQIIELEKENRKFGISAADSAAAMADLIGGLSGFGLMAADTQTAIADEVSELQRLGAASGDVVGVMQTATKSFGMTETAAMELTQGAETLAQELGISIGQAVSDLNKALPQLANLSERQIGPAFKRLSEQAIETGLSIDQLTGIADKFMTFEDAGRAASSLNAVLGTQMFDTMSLLEAQMEGPQAFIDTFREQLGGAVGDFDSLTVFQKQAIANAAGMSTVELRNLMNAEQLTEEQKKQAKEREDNLKAAMALKDELLALAAELTVALTPVITFVKNMMSFMAKFLEFSRKAGEFIPKIGGTLGTIAGAVGIAKAGGIAAKGIRGLLGIGEKLGTPSNPMITKDVDAKDDLAEEIGDKVKDGVGSVLEKLGKKVPGGGALGSMRDTISKKGLLGGLGGWLKKKGGLMAAAKLGARFVPGLNIAMLAGDAYSMGKRFLADGTNSTMKGPHVVGEEGPELVIPPPRSAVVNNSNFENGFKSFGSALLSNVGLGASKGDQAIIRELANLGVKLDAINASVSRKGDTVMKVNKREFGRLVNSHMGAPGSSPQVGVE